MTINDVVRCLEGSRKILVRLWIPRGYLSCQDTEEIHYFPHFPAFPMKFGGKTTKYSKSVVHKSCRVCLEIKHISSFTKSAFNYCHSICNTCSSRKGHKRQRINFAENSQLGLEPLHEILEKKNATQLIEDERSSFSVDSDTTSRLTQICLFSSIKMGLQNPFNICCRFISSVHRGYQISKRPR